MKYAALVSLVLFTALTAMGADKKISELNYLGQASWSTLDLLPIVDVSGAETKNTKISDFDARYFHKGTDVLGIISGGTGLSSVPAAGSLIFSNGTTFSLVGSACTSGQVLASNGSGVWACSTPAVGTITNISVGTGMSGGGSSGSVSVGVNGELQGLSALSTTGYVRRTAPGTFSTSSIDLTADVTGTLPLANGGTGQTSASAAINALVPTQTGQSGKFLSTNGSVVSWATGGGGGGSVTDVTASAPLLSSGGSTPDISIPVATSSADGYLASADWITFSGKQNALTLGNLTAAGTDGIAVTGGTGSVVGSGTSVAQHVADSTHNGYLTSTDWSTFNSKGSGTVTSVAMTVPSFLSVAGSPVTSTGTLAVTLATQSANLVFAGPASGSAAAPTFRSLVQADIPFPLKAPITILANPPSYGFAGGDDDTGIYSTGDGNVSIQANGNLKAEFNQNDIQLYSGSGVTVNTDLTVTGNIAAANYPPTGSANRIASYDGAGALASSVWQTSENDPFYSNPGNPTTGDFRGITIDSNGVGPGAVTGMSLNNAMTSVNNIHILDLNNTADSADSYQGIGNFNSGVITNGLNMESVGNSGNVGGQIRLMEGSNSGTAAGGILYNLYNQSSGVMSGQFNLMNLGDAATTTGNWQGLDINKQGDVTGAVGGINFNLDAAATSDVTMLTMGQNNAHAYGASFTGANVYNASGSTVVGNATMMYLNDNSDSDGKTGLNVNLQGATSSYVHGISVNVANVTGYTDQPEALSLNGGALSVQSPYDTLTLTPGGEFQNNSLGGEFHISAGHPVTGSFGFGNNLGITLLAEDDMDPDLFLGSSSLGFSVNGFVNQIAVVSGKTVDTLNYMAAGGSFPAPSTGGTVVNTTMFRALGLINGGGSLNLTNLWGFKADGSLCGASPTKCWGVSVEDTTADNWFAKNMVVGGSTMLPTNASVGVEIAGTTKALLISRLTTTQKNALTAVNGMQVYDTTLDEFDCYAAGAWAACGGGGGGSGITALTGDVTASGTGSVAATLATVNSNVGTFGSASVIPSITVNAKGLITAVATNTVNIDAILPTQTGNSGKVLTTNGTNSSWITPAALSSNFLFVEYTASSIVVNAGADAIYDTMVFDNSASAYNPATGEFTVPSDGFYFFRWSGSSIARGTSYGLKVNGTPVSTAVYSAGATASMEDYKHIFLTAGDIVKVFNFTGIGEQMNANATDNRFEIIRVGSQAGSVIAPTSGIVTQVFGNVTGSLTTPTFSANVGFSSSISRASAGLYTMTFSTAFSSTPTCVCNNASSGVLATTCSIASISTTSVQVALYNIALLSGADNNLTLDCKGLK